MRKIKSFGGRFLLVFFAAFAVFSYSARTEAASQLPVLAIARAESRLPTALAVGDEEASLLAITDYLMAELTGNDAFDVTDFVEGMDFAGQEAYIVYPYLTALNGYTSSLHLQDRDASKAVGGGSGTVEADIVVKIVDATTHKEFFIAHGEGKSSTKNQHVSYEQHAVSGGTAVSLDANVDGALFNAAQDAANKIKTAA